MSGWWYADLLLALLLLLFIADVLPGETGRVADGAWRAGLWGGLAFLAQPYALPVVLVVVVVANLIAARRARRRGEASTAGGHTRRVAVTLATSAVMVAAWSAVLSFHYGEPTLNRAWSYNLAMVAPGSEGQPLRRGLVEPPYPEALFAWEDPSTMPLVSGGWAAPGDSVRRLIQNLAANIRDLAVLLAGTFVFVPLFALVGALVLVRRRRLIPPHPRSVWPALVLTVAIYLGGSLVTFVEAQFLWFAVLALVPLAAVGIDLPILRPRLHPGDRNYPAWRLAGFILLAAGVTVEAAVNLPASPQGARIADIAARVEAQAPQADASLKGARVASTDDWEASSILCFQLGCTYLGEAGTGPRAAAEVSQRADYLVVWSGRPGERLVRGPPVVSTTRLRLYATGS